MPEEKLKKLIELEESGVLGEGMVYKKIKEIVIQTEQEREEPSEEKESKEKTEGQETEEQAEDKTLTGKERKEAIMEAVEIWQNEKKSKIQAMEEAGVKNVNGNDYTIFKKHTENENEWEGNIEKKRELIKEAAKKFIDSDKTKRESYKEVLGRIPKGNDYNQFNRQLKKLKEPKNNFQRWTQTELETVLKETRMQGRNRAVQKLSKAFNRSENAVKTQLSCMLNQPWKNLSEKQKKALKSQGVRVGESEEQEEDDTVEVGEDTKIKRKFSFMR